MKEKVGVLGEMSLSLFENILREQCGKDYVDLKNGKRRARLQKKRDEVRAMKDLIKGVIDASDLSESCLRTFGTTIEKASGTYANRQGAKPYKSRVGTIKIDTLWEYKGTCYDLESKANINLDKGKSRNTKSELTHKRKVAIHSFMGEMPVVSGIIVWTQPTGEKAIRLAKKSLKKTKMFGYLDFFKIFNVTISEQEYKEMIRRVWREEIEAYFSYKPPEVEKGLEPPQLKMEI